MKPNVVPFVGLSCGLLLAGLAGAQTPGFDPAYAPPRLPSGKPDLQGIWSNAVVTPLERPADLADKEFMTEDEARAYARQRVETVNRDKRPDESDEFTPEMEQKQTELYSGIFRILRENRNAISAVTFWNVTDKRSWLDNFPVRGRKNYPLLFDKDGKPKKAYWEVVRMTE